MFSLFPKILKKMKQWNLIYFVYYLSFRIYFFNQFLETSKRHTGSLALFPSQRKIEIWGHHVNYFLRAPDTTFSNMWKDFWITLHRALIRFKCNYGVGIYSSATKILMKSLNIVYHSAHRLATSCYPTTASVNLAFYY